MCRWKYVAQVGDDVDTRRLHQRQPVAADARPRTAWADALLEQGSDVVLALDAELRVRFASPSIARVLGVSPDAAVDRHLLDVIVAEDTATLAVSATHWATVAGVHPRVGAGVRHADGTPVHVELVAANRLDDPAVGAVILTVTDRTAVWDAEQRRLAAERALRAREALFRAVVQESSDVTMVLDADVRISYASPSLQRHLGLAPEDVLGMNGLDLVHPDDRDWVAEDFAHKVENPEHYQAVEFRVRAAEGEWRVAEAIGTNLLDDPDIRGIVVTFRDVTERHEAQAALQASEERYRRVVERSPIAIAVHRDGELLYANPATVRLLGADSATELIGRQVLDLVHPSWRALAEARMRSAQAGHDQPPLEFRLRRLDGTEIDVETVAIPTVFDDHPAVQVVAHDVSGRKRAEAQLAHQATHDPLTGLPNRTLLLDRLEQALRRAVRRPSGVAVLFVDLDRFKVVNDSLGHDRGDELLIAVARRLRECVRPGDTVARFGGDEFVILCEGLDDGDDAVGLARRLQSSLDGPLDAGGEEMYASASIGLALAREGSTARDLLRDADAAMYDAKARGGSRFEVFDSEMRHRVLRQLELEQSLRRAIDNDELRILYQPEVALPAGRIVGAEALVRWEHPTLGLLSPDQFLPVAEETGIVVALGRNVLLAACRAAARWRTEGLGGPDPWVGVNLSAHELTQPDALEFIAGVLEATGLPASSLCLEITERTVMADPDGARRAITAMKELGVQFALDDFGTGYSSLEHLIQFPLDFVKVDRSFTDGLGDDTSDTAIVTAIVGMAKALGISVIAEGVETRGQLAELRRLGAGFAQGHLIAEAMEEHELRALLVRDPRW